MSYELTKEEKITIVNQHLKTLEYSRYNIQMSMDQENAIENPSQIVIGSLTNQLAENDARKAVLLAELDELNLLES